MLTVGSLFAGIGGIDRGLEQTGGFRTIWQVEIDPYCRCILEKHWPGVPKYGDIRTLSSDGVARPDMLAGGFPCTDLSTAGYRAGLAGSRSGLWGEYLRLVRDLRPRYVLVENVAGIRYLNRQRGTTEPAALSIVLGDLAEAGYDAEWTSVYAYQFGYPHWRERCFIVAYPAGLGCPPLFSDLPYYPKPTLQGSLGRMGWARRLLEEFEQRVGEPALLGSPAGIPHRFHRLRVLGNAVMPEMAQLIGERILRCEVELGSTGECDRVSAHA
jgi:DNA (cytosine-5)-methyltransferase 1